MSYGSAPFGSSPFGYVGQYTINLSDTAVATNDSLAVEGGATARPQKPEKGAPGAPPEELDVTPIVEPHFRILPLLGRRP